MSDVAGGDSYTVKTSFTAPNVAPGSYYVVLFTDANSNLSESDETNNSSLALAAPITITP